MSRDRVRIGPVDGRAILERLAGLPIVRWRYEWESDRTHHLGPSPREFDEAFGLGVDGRLIEPLDASGVAMAGIQALDERIEALEARLIGLEALEARLEPLEARLEERPDARGFDHRR